MISEDIVHVKIYIYRLNRKGKFIEMFDKYYSYIYFYKRLYRDWK